MTIYKRGSTWWSDFSIGSRRFRISLRTSDRREAVRREKLRIADAQNSGGLLVRKTVGVTTNEATAAYLSARESAVSAHTLYLERSASKQLLRHLGSKTIGSLSPESLTAYVRLRKAESVGHRTINIEIGILRRILKRFRLWSLVGESYKPLPEPKNIGRALTAEQELKLFEVASSRPEWAVACWASLITANTTAGGCEIRNLRLRDVELDTQTLYVKVGKNRFRIRALPLNQTALWAVKQLLDRAHTLGAVASDHYLIPRRIGGKDYDPAQPATPWAWRTAWRNLTKKAGLPGLRPHDLRHHAVTKLAESLGTSEQTIMALAGHVSRAMLEHYSHVRREAKQKAVAGIENVTITAQLDRWKTLAEQKRVRQVPEGKRKKMVGAAGLEPATLCLEGRCSIHLSYAPMLPTSLFSIFNLASEY